MIIKNKKKSQSKEYELNLKGKKKTRIKSEKNKNSRVALKIYRGKLWNREKKKKEERKKKQPHAQNPTFACHACHSGTKMMSWGLKRHHKSWILIVKP